MELYNGTPEKISQRFDGVVYNVDRFEVTSVREAAGDFLKVKCKSRGLVEVRFGTDPDKARLECLKQSLARYLTFMRKRENQQRRQEEMKFPPLPKDAMTIASERGIPILKVLIEELAKKLGVSAVPEATRAMMAPMSEDKVDMPALGDMTIDQLRETARGMKIEFNTNWQRSKFVKEIESFTAPVVEHEPA